MKSFTKVFGVLAAALLLWQGVAVAEVVQGQVTAVNPEDRSLTVQKAALAAGEEGDEIKLSVPESAELRGVQIFEEVEVGDEIRAEANKPALGIGSWEARWIEKSASDAIGDVNAGSINKGVSANDRQFQGQQAGFGQQQQSGQTAGSNAGQGQSY